MPPPPERVRIDNLARRVETPQGVVWRCWGAGPPVILVHGGSGSWMHWIRNVEHLARDYAVWAVDLPGCGESAAPPAGTDFFGQAELTVQSWRGIGSRDEPIRLVGFSVGASVAAAMAVSMGNAIDRLVLIGGCYAGPHPRPRRKLLDHRGIADPDILRDIHYRNIATMMIDDPALIDDLAVYIQGHNISCDRFERRRLSAPEAMRQALPDVTVPVAGLWGERDTLAVPAVQMPGLKAIKPGAVQHVLQRAGHWAGYENAASCNARLEECLS